MNTIVQSQLEAIEQQIDALLATCRYALKVRPHERRESLMLIVGELSRIAKQARRASDLKRST